MAATCPGLQRAERPCGGSRQHLCSTVRSPHQNKREGLDYHIRVESKGESLFLTSTSSTGKSVAASEKAGTF